MTRPRYARPAGALFPAPPRHGYGVGDLAGSAFDHEWILEPRFEPRLPTMYYRHPSSRT